MDKLVRKPLQDKARCQCGCLVAITLFGGECYSCGSKVEPLLPKFQRTLADIRALPEASRG